METDSADLTADQLPNALRETSVLQAGHVKTVTADSTCLTMLSRIVSMLWSNNLEHHEGR